MHITLLEISDFTKDPKIKNETISQVNNEFTHELVLRIVRYKLLFTIYQVSKS